VTFKARQDWFAFNVRLTFSKSRLLSSGKRLGFDLCPFGLCQGTLDFEWNINYEQKINLICTRTYVLPPYLGSVFGT
jgi:hypothetical protein